MSNGRQAIVERKIQNNETVQRMLWLRAIF